MKENLLKDLLCLGRVMAGRTALVVMASMAVCGPARSAVLGVDWGGNYTGGASSNFATNYATLGSYHTGDYNFDGTANDTAQVVDYGTVFTPTTSPGYANLSGKTGRLYTAAQLVNLGSTTNPIFNTYRLSSAPATALQVSEMQGASATTSMRESVAFYATKADFLGGLNTAAGVGFANVAGGATMAATFANLGSSVDQGRLLVQNGLTWYVSATAVTTASPLSAAYNPYADLWYAYDPSVTQFLDTSNFGVGVAGSTFNDIEAFGIFMQTGIFDGIAGKPTMASTGFSAAMLAVPEPSTVAFLMLGGLVLLFGVRIKAANE